MNWSLVSVAVIAITMLEVILSTDQGLDQGFNQPPPQGYKPRNCTHYDYCNGQDITCEQRACPQGQRINLKTGVKEQFFEI